MATEFRITPYKEYFEGIQGLRQYNLERIQLKDNPWGMIQYVGEDIFSKVILFPVVAFVDGEKAGYTCIYNVSDSVVRTGGIYVEPKFRRGGVGVGLYEHALSLWPKEFNRFITYYKNESFIKFSGKFGMQEVPGYYWRTNYGMGSIDHNSRVILAQKTIAK